MGLRSRLVLSALALALPVSAVTMWGVQSASAGSPPTDGTGTVSCTSATGLLKFSPSLTFTGSGNSDRVTAKVQLHGCNVSAGSNVTSTNFNGKGTGSITASSDNCSSLAGTQSVTGSVTVKWTAKAGKGHINPTKITFTALTGEPVGTNGNVGFTFSNQAVSGSFSSTSSTVSGELDTNETAAAASGNSAGGCGAKKGMRKLNIVAGTTSQP
jgi:hypothetical protein